MPGILLAGFEEVYVNIPPQQQMICLAYTPPNHGYIYYT